MSKENDVVKAIEDRANGLINYANVYAVPFFYKVKKEFPKFGAFVTENELYSVYNLGFTLAALGISMHSPVLAMYNNKEYALKSLEKGLTQFFEGFSDVYDHFEGFLAFLSSDFETYKSVGYHFADLVGIWLVSKLPGYESTDEEHELVKLLGNHICDHFIYSWEDTWIPKDIDSESIIKDIFTP